MASRNPQALSVQWNPQKRLPRERPLTTPMLRVEVQGGEIVVTASDTDYVVTYHKPANSPQLQAKSYSRKEDRRVSMTLAQFLTDAWKLAKARRASSGGLCEPEETRPAQLTQGRAPLSTSADCRWSSEFNRPQIQPSTGTGVPQRRRASASAGVLSESDAHFAPESDR
jgi:hypothetical protein